MHADAHFVIGKAHVNGGKPCQDYAAAGELPGGGAFAIVADGCSSGGRTDVGARLVTLATAAVLEKPIITPWSRILLGHDPMTTVRSAVRSRQRSTLEASQALLGLVPSDLLATCGYLYACEDFAAVNLHGDGVIAEIFPDGLVHLTRYEWADNTPVYPAYMLDDYAGFISHHGGDIDKSILTAEFVAIEVDGKRHSEHYNWSMFMGLDGISYQPNREVSRLAIFTDGVTQVEGMTWQDAALELLGFKSLTGEFVKRRLNRFVRDAAKVGRGPLDDVAYAVIDLAQPRNQQDPEVPTC